MILQNVRYISTAYVVLQATWMLICILNIKLLVPYLTIDHESQVCQDNRLELLLGPHERSKKRPNWGICRYVYFCFGCMSRCESLNACVYVQVLMDGNFWGLLFCYSITLIMFPGCCMLFIYKIILNRYNNKHCHLQLALHFIKCIHISCLILIPVAALRNS